MKKQLLTLLLCLICLTGCAPQPVNPPASAVPEISSAQETAASEVITLDRVPEYSGMPYVELNGNVPEFSPEQFNTDPYEFYTDLDQLGRCGACYANLCQELMPTEERGSISSVHPSGWLQAQYDCVDGKSLYNRCHLIGFQLTGENANEHNLITGTRYLNVDGMLPFENMLAEYIRETGHHVLYRVTPVFEGSNLVASGVQLEAASVEDDTIRFNVYCYNVQPGVIINYETGESALAETQSVEGETADYVLNTSAHKFHLPTCPSVDAMKEENRQSYTGSRERLIDSGYAPCGRCNP